MNTVYFSGKLKKKYNAADVQNTICAFAKEHGFSVQCPDENKAFVDFRVDSEGFCFSVENGELTEQCIKHEVDDAGKFWRIYELLYQFRSLFSEYEVFDDLGIWADYCYQKEPVQINLRELTEEEAEIKNYLNIFHCTDSCQILLGIIELFIWDKAPFKDEVLGDWSTMIQKIRDERHRAAGVCVYGIIDTWIYYCMDFCGKPVSEYPEDIKNLMRQCWQPALDLQPISFIYGADAPENLRKILPHFLSTKIRNADVGQAADWISPLTAYIAMCFPLWSILDFV